MKKKKLVSQGDISYKIHMVDRIGGLSIGTSEQEIIRNALTIIRSHKKECKRLLSYCSKERKATPAFIQDFQPLAELIIQNIQSDLDNIDFVYSRYRKCLIKFITIIETNLIAKKIAHTSLYNYRNKDLRRVTPIVGYHIGNTLNASSETSEKTYAC